LSARHRRNACVTVRSKVPGTAGPGAAALDQFAFDRQIQTLCDNAKFIAVLDAEERFIVGRSDVDPVIEHYRSVFADWCNAGEL